MIVYVVEKHIKINPISLNKMTFLESYINVTQGALDAVMIACLKSNNTQEFCDRNNTWVSVHLSLALAMGASIFIFLVLSILQQIYFCFKKEDNFIEQTP